MTPLSRPRVHGDPELSPRGARGHAFLRASAEL